MMLPDAFYTGRPVLSLQTMLRTISFRHPMIPRIIPDGIFGEHTLEAVMVFQREFSPPVTGRVDHSTWSAITALFQEISPSLSSPRLLTAYPGFLYSISPGETSIHLHLIQSMFRALSQIVAQIENCEVSGVSSEATVRNICFLQKLLYLEETGVFDQAVWNLLSRLYALFVSAGQISAKTFYP